MTNALRLSATSTSTVTNAAATLFTNSTDKTVTVRFSANVDSHISTTGTATTDSAYVFGGLVELIAVDPGKSISVIRSGDQDGIARATVVERV